jgi:tetratricopeptide (TPR) repeat protein
MEPRELSGFWFGEAFDWIRSNPGDWLGLMFKKARNYLGAYEIPDNLDYYLYRESSPVLRLPLPGFGLVAPLGLLGAILAFSREAWPRALMLFFVSYSASVLLFFVFSRFRMAAMPALFVFAGYALCRLFGEAKEAIRRSRVDRALLSHVTLLVAFFAFVNLPVRGPAGLWSVRLAETVGLPVRAETTATGRYNLGLAFAIQAGGSDDPRELLGMAETELREALRQDARHAKVHVELGKVLARMERNREAIEAYRAALGVEPGDWRTHLSLGLLHRREGEAAAAEDAFRMAAGLEPRSAMAHIQLGETLLELGRSGEAAGSFETALRISPGSDRAQRGLEEARRAEGRGP